MNEKSSSPERQPPEREPTRQPLGERLSALMVLVGSIPKDSTNDFHHYSYTGADAVLGKVQDALPKVGLCILGTREEVDRVIEIQTKNGPTPVVIVRTTIRIGCTDEAGEFATFSALGAGMDSGDKGVMKGATASYKYALRDGLCIPFGDNPEGDAGTDRATSSASTAAPPRRYAPAPPPVAPPLPKRDEAEVMGEIERMREEDSGEEEDKWYTAPSGRSYRIPKCACGEFAKPWIKADRSFGGRFYCAKPKGDSEKCDFVLQV